MKSLKPTNSSYLKLVNQLYKNKPVIIPTDTNYNLACLPDDKIAIDHIFEYKERPKNKPLSLFFLNPKDWKLYGECSDEKLMSLIVDNFWPGPLNIVIKNKTTFSYMLNDSSTISLGSLSNPSWRKFMTELNQPLAITSANISGTADDLLITEKVAHEHMGEKVKYMLKSDIPITSTCSSTIISLENGITILREGDISKEKIQKVLESEGYSID